MFEKPFKRLLQLSLACLAFALTAIAQTNYKLTYVEASAKETFIVASAINNAGDVVGTYEITGGGNVISIGFERLTNGTILKVVDPLSNEDIGSASGINNSGEIIGDYDFKSRSREFYQGFTDINGTFTTYSVEPDQQTVISGLNDSGDFVGTYFKGNASYGFVNIGGNVTDINYPGATGSNPVDIDNAGIIAGNYVDSSNVVQGFLINSFGEILGTLSYPGSTGTYLGGINNHNDVAGYYYDSSGTHGFTYKSGVYTSFDVPNATQTSVFGINDNGQLCGYFATAAGGYKAFIATPVQ